MYWGPSNLTEPRKFHLDKGGDEWHNYSVMVGVPFLGMLIFFYERKFNRDGEPHVYAFCTPEGFVGAFHKECEDCVEFVITCEELAA